MRDLDFIYALLAMLLLILVVGGSNANAAPGEQKAIADAGGIFFLATKYCESQTLTAVEKAAAEGVQVTTEQVSDFYAFCMDEVRTTINYKLLSTI